MRTHTSSGPKGKGALTGSAPFSRRTIEDVYGVVKQVSAGSMGRRRVLRGTTGEERPAATGPESYRWDVPLEQSMVVKRRCWSHRIALGFSLAVSSRSQSTEGGCHTGIARAGVPPTNRAAARMSAVRYLMGQPFFSVLRSER